MDEGTTPTPGPNPNPIPPTNPTPTPPPDPSPAPNVTPPAVGEPPKKSNKTAIIVVSVIAGVLLLCCVASAATFLVFRGVVDKYNSSFQEIQDLNDSWDDDYGIPEMQTGELGDTLTAGDVKITCSATPGEDSSNGVTSVDIIIENNSDEMITIPIDGGWSALDIDDELLEYNYTEIDSKPETLLGVIEAGHTYRATLSFTDSTLTPKKAVFITASPLAPIDGVELFNWFVMTQ